MSRNAANGPVLSNTPPAKAQLLLQTLARILEVINSTKLGYTGRLGQILDIILEYLGVEQGSIMLVERHKLVVRAASRHELIGISQLLSDNSVAAGVARSGQVAFIKDISKDLRFTTKAPRNQYKSNSLLSAPITHDKKVIGVINVTDKSGNRDLLQEDVTCLLNIAAMMMALIVQENMTAEIKKQRNTLKKRNLELRRRETKQAELSRMLVHDIKGPLSEVIALLDILSYSISDDNREFLQSAQVACDRAVTMAANLGTVAKLEDGKMSLVLEEVEPDDIINEALLNFKGLASIQGISLASETDKDLPPLRLDRVLIQRVLQNLLTNGLRYAPKGSTITAGCRREGKRHLLFFIRDLGPGISRENQSAIFEKYASLGRTQSPFSGTGLGLYFCRLTVQEHGGDIGLHSILGEGSTFFFTLPLGKQP